MLIHDDNLARLERDLRQAVVTGTLVPSTRLLSARALAAQYTLTYGRVLRVLKKLEKQGLLVSKHGGGTFVADSVPGKAPLPGSSLISRNVASVVAPRHFWQLGQGIWFNMFIRGFEARVHSFGGSVEMVALEDFLTKETHPCTTVLLTSFVNAQVREALRSISRSGRNVMLVGSDPIDADWALTMDIDGKAGIESALQCLFEFGHQNIGFISWDLPDELKPTCRWWVAEREAAFNGGMKSKKFDPLIARLPHPGLHMPPEMNSSAADRILDEFLKKNAGISGLICVNDSAAKYVLAFCDRHGVNVPGNISVIGFDNDEWTMSAGLTTLARPYREQGESAANIAWQAATNPLFQLRGNLSIVPQLVRRNSVRAV